VVVGKRRSCREVGVVPLFELKSIALATLMGEPNRSAKEVSLAPSMNEAVGSTSFLRSSRMSNPVESSKARGFRDSPISFQEGRLTERSQENSNKMLF
jgi:hypothetical protein